MAVDVVVIGAGQNGLAAAVRLADAKKKVVVVEARDRVGGLCSKEEFHPGYFVPGMLHDTGLVRSEVLDALGLGKKVGQRDDPGTFVPGPEGGLVLSKDAAATKKEIARRSAKDVEGYATYRGFFDRVKSFLRDVANAPPDPLSPTSKAELWSLGKRGLALRRLGKEDMVEILRVAPMCVADWLNEFFETPELVEALAAPAVVGSFLGPWSAGSAANLLMAEGTSEKYLAGGPPALVSALHERAKSLGVEVRLSSRVTRIRVEDDRVIGVTLSSGEDIECRSVAASCDPKQTILELIHPSALPVRFEDQVRAVRARGTTAKVHVALSGPLSFDARPEILFESARLGGGHVDALERAFDAVKYGRFSERPQLEIRVPTVADPTLAPAGHHVASILVSFAPHDLRQGWSDATRSALGERVLQTLEASSKGVREKIVATEVLTPKDLSTRYGLSGGHLFHVEPALDQLLFMRPTASAARYATPIKGLFLAGSGSHPGGGVSAAPGLLAAETMLRE
ncbi:MAG: NAD(P)/FAD-dependent oxidoreductase [Deltaproteobacteria bacterium]|nr:NAD(P)/FAD-dependent oxidoreductase [Deltaproteobacteria bacterium]